MTDSYLGALPAPPGMQSNFDDPPSQLQANIALHTVCLLLATLSVAVRLYTRAFITEAKFGLDDGFCVLSYALSVASAATMIKSYSWGIGRHMWDVPVTWVSSALKFWTISQYIILVFCCSIKLTFFFLYNRIFWAQEKVRYCIKFGIVFVLCSHLGLLLFWIFSCLPPAQVWELSPKGRCAPPKAFPYVFGALTLATDLYIWILPMLPCWRLCMDVEKRLRVVAIFALGSLACIASLVRFVKSPVLNGSSDATWNTSKLGVWALIEVNVGIVCASSTSFPAFADRFCPSVVRKPISRLWVLATSPVSTTHRSARTTTRCNARNSERQSKWMNGGFIEMHETVRHWDAIENGPTAIHPACLAGVVPSCLGNEQPDLELGSKGYADR